jgi:hypothetical protein
MGKVIKVFNTQIKPLIQIQKKQSLGFLYLHL